jgi:hypothetical protein
MKKLILISLLLSVALFGQNRPSAIVLKVKGTANLTARNTDDVVALKKSQILYSGDKIETGAKSFVALKFLDDASLLRLRSNSEITIKGEWKEERQDKSIFVSLGRLWASITRQKSKFEVRTPTAVASVKGTKFWSIHTEDGGSLFIGEEGLVEIANELGKVTMKAGESAKVKDKDTAPEVGKTDPNDIPKDEDTGEARQLKIRFNDGETTKELEIELK